MDDDLDPTVEISTVVRAFANTLADGLDAEDPTVAVLASYSLLHLLASVTPLLNLAAQQQLGLSETAYVKAEKRYTDTLLQYLPNREVFRQEMEEHRKLVAKAFQAKHAHEN